MAVLTGREEHTLQLENKIKEMLAEQNPILTDWYCAMSASATKTKETYLYRLIKFFEWLDNEGIEYDKVTYLNLNRYINSIKTKMSCEPTKSYSATYIRGQIYAIKSFYGFLYEAELIGTNPADKIKAPAVKKDTKVVYMNQDEVCRVNSTIKEYGGADAARDAVLFQIGCMTGLRATAITEINVSDVRFNPDINYETFDKDDHSFDDIPGGNIRVVDKGGYEKEVGFDVRVGKNLYDYIKNDRPGYVNKKVKTDALFLTKRGKRLYYGKVREIVTKYTEATIGLDKHITPHKMRSTCGTTTFIGCHDIMVTKEKLGHKNVANTMRYVAVAEEDVVKATNNLGKTWNF